MSSSLISLHKVLKDETRRKIVLLLNDNCSLSYTNLLDRLEDISTGLLNYHLKVLGDLILKNENSHYILSEKGKLASRLLVEFPEEYNQLKRKHQRQFWTVVAISNILMLTSFVILYFLNYIDFTKFLQVLIASSGGIALAYFGYKLQCNKTTSVWSEKTTRFKIGYTLGGIWLGLFIVFFGTPLFSWLSISLGGPNLLNLVGTPFEFIVIIVVSAIVGGIIGYYLGKKNGFCKPKWMTRMDDKLGF